MAFSPGVTFDLTNQGTNHIAVGGTVIGVYLIFGREVTQRLTVRDPYHWQGARCFANLN